MHGPFEEMQLYGAWLALPVFSTPFVDRDKHK